MVSVNPIAVLYKYFLVLCVFLVLSGCNVLSSPKMPIPTPELSDKKTVSVCRYNKQQVFVMAALPALDVNGSCHPFYRVDLNQKILQWRCVKDGVCGALGFGSLSVLAPIQVSSQLNISQVRAIQTRVIAQHKPLVVVSPTSDIDGFLKQALRHWEQIGVNTGKVNFVGFGVEGVYTLLAANDEASFEGAMLNAQTIVSVDPSASLQLSAGFNVKACEHTGSLGVAPQKPQALVLMATAIASKPDQVFTLVKHSLDLNGQSKRQTFTVATSACVMINDDSFDPAHPSVYYLRADGTALSSPIWYLPIQA